MKKAKYLLVGAIGLMVFGLTGCGGTKVDITDYVMVEFSGVNGQGSAVCNLDSVSLEQALAGDDDGEISMEELEKLGWITQFEMTLSCEMDEDSELSNGDTVTVTVSYDEDLAKENKVTVTGTTKEFEVEGLKDPIEVDAFASDIFDTDNGVTLEYSSLAPTAYLSVVNNCTSEPESLITYTADKTNNINNGDQITITAELPASAADEGYVLKETEKTITVEGLDAYVTSLSQLNDPDKAEVLDAAEKNFLASAEKHIDFYDVNNANVDMNTESTTFTNFAFSEDTYDTSKNNVLVIPFTVDTTGSYFWIGRDFYNDKISKTYNGANGFIVVQGLVVNSEGDLVSNDNDVYYEVEGMYEDKAKMESVINADYGV